VIWGISTTKHAHSGLDVLTQIEPVANVVALAAAVDRAIPTAGYPTIRSVPSRIIKRRPTDTRGVVATYIPPTQGDPVQSLVDRQFYLRTVDGFVEMPYDVLRRMFAGSTVPELRPQLYSQLVTRDAGTNLWRIPIVLENLSSAAATFTYVQVTVINPDACDSINAVSLQDQSSLNPGRTVYGGSHGLPILRGIGQQVGALLVSMKRNPRPRRILNLEIQLVSVNMRGRRWSFRVHLGTAGFAVRETRSEFLY
jgi:hypothetical protein